MYGGVVLFIRTRVCAVGKFWWLLKEVYTYLCKFYTLHQFSECYTPVPTHKKCVNVTLF